MKMCWICGDEKELSAFRKAGKNGQGEVLYKNFCNPCDNDRSKRLKLGEKDIPIPFKPQSKNLWFFSRLRNNMSRGGGEVPTVQELSDLIGYPKACYLCGETLISDAEIDHIVPKARGGLNSVENLAWACRRCNRAKHDYLLEEFLETAERILRHHGRI